MKARQGIILFWKSHFSLILFRNWRMSLSPHLIHSRPQKYKETHGLGQEYSWESTTIGCMLCSRNSTLAKVSSTQKYKGSPKQAGCQDDISFSDQWSSELRDLATWTVIMMKISNTIGYKAGRNPWQDKNLILSSPSWPDQPIKAEEVTFTAQLCARLTSPIL